MSVRPYNSTSDFVFLKPSVRSKTILAKILVTVLTRTLAPDLEDESI